MTESPQIPEPGRGRVLDADAAAEPRFRELAEHVPSLVWTCRPDGVGEYLSPQWREFTGIDEHELTGAARFELIHPEDRSATVRAWVTSTTEGIPYEVQLRLRRHDGTWRWFQARAVPLRDEAGRIVRWFGTNTDIEREKKAEERQRLLSESAASLLAAADPAALMGPLFARIRRHLDVDVYVHALVEPGGETLRLISWAGLTDEEARALEPAGIGQGIAGSAVAARTAVVATSIRTSDDPRVQGARALGLRAMVCRPLLDEGRAIGTLAFASHRRDSFEEEDLDFMRTITHYVEVAHQRMRLVQELKAEHRRKDEFLATLSHELRNPLAPLRHSLEVMRLAAADTATIESARRVMERQLGQMVRLIDDLLDVSRISSGKITLKRARIELAPVLANAIEINRPLLDSFAHAFEAQVPAEPIHLDADAARLIQVFDNLLNNACKYTERGGRIRLAVERRASTGTVAVTVSDSGIGIPADMLGRVFDMFAQVDHAADRAQGGLGLGLNIVQRLVEKHGGTVVASSEGPGKGSTFTVHLPLAASGEAAATPAAKPEAAPEGKRRRRVLVVDDNKDAALTLKMMIDLMGSEARLAYGGLEALEVAEAFRPDLVLLDIGMPGLNGYDTARRMRAQAWGREVVLVALTGWGQDEDRQRSQAAGFDEHVVKPIEPAALEKLLAWHRRA